MTTSEFIKLVEEEIKEPIFEADETATIDNIEVIQVWYCKTIQNHKGLFIVRNIDNNVIYPHFVEATYNGDAKELYLDFYEKQFKHIINCDNY